MYRNINTYLFYINLYVYIHKQGAFLIAQLVKNLPDNAGDLGSMPGLGRSPREGNGNPLQYSCREIPWTEEPGGLQSLMSQRVGHDLATKQQGQSPH